MPVRRLDDQRAAELRSAPLSYAPTGGTNDDVPLGLTRLSRSVVLDRRDFDGAARDLFAWRMHAEAGVDVHASDVPLRLGSVVLMRLGFGVLALKAPCRVVEVVTETRRQGFAYGTLPGHPEAGEERFVLEHLDDGRVQFSIIADSRPASTLAKLGGPLSRAAQRAMTRRYLEALDRL